MKYLAITLCIAGLFMFMPEILFAQATPPPPMLPTDPSQAPLGGLSLLAAAGGAYAWKKLRNSNPS